MDTPDKKTQPSPSVISKFEDSPVFNYISSLSPIKPFNLSHAGQSFHLLSFSSPQSLQTSPSTNCSKESKVTSASHASEVSRKSCSENGSDKKVALTTDAEQQADLHIEEGDKIDSGGEVTANATDESSKLVTEFSKYLKYDCGSPGNNEVHCDAVKPGREVNVAGSETSPVKGIQSISKEPDCSFGNEIDVQGIQMVQNKDVCEWERFIYGASDILNCHSPTTEEHRGELDDKSVDSGTLSFVTTVLQLPNENVDDPRKPESPSPLLSSQNHDIEVLVAKPEGTGKPNGRSQLPAVKAHVGVAEEAVNYSSTRIDDKQQTARRRCLVYEMSGAHYRKLLSGPEGSSPTSEPSANDKSLVASKPGSNRFSSLLPGIGLHLNALAATAKDKIIVKRQTLTCRRQLISSPCTISSFDSLTCDVKPISTPMTPELVGRDRDDQKDGVQVTENACQDSTFGDGTEFHQTSPKKKRKKSDIAGETDSCKLCNCKRSKCLKLYCECFAAGLYCVEPCNCQNCLNKPEHEEIVLETRRQIESRNPLAFAPKVIRLSSTLHNGEESNKTPASARHKRGCNCKKSGCLKKYCECFQGGVGCSLSCRCEGCKNTFGRKEGREVIICEEKHILEKSATDVSSHIEVTKPDEEHQDQATLEPSKHTRQPVRRPFHFGCVDPQFPSRPSEPSLQPCTSQQNDESDQTAFEEDLKIIPGDEALEVLEGDYPLPITCVKSTSPNCKRISPPHYGFETSSSGWRSCRKLILRSISSFPTVTPKQETTELQGELQ